MFIIRSHRFTSDTLRKNYPDAYIIDVTSKGHDPWIRFSPFYPHGNIPVPFSPGLTAASVEGIWQGLKVFEQADVDPRFFANASMKNLKRTTRKYGKVLGHSREVNEKELLAYREARYAIYLPSYHWVLEHCLQLELAQLKQYAQPQQVILVDYETNCDLENLSRPLSHAGLIKRYLEGCWPE